MASASRSSSWFSSGFSVPTLLLVMIGGAIGVAARAALTTPFGAEAHPLAVPGITLAINVLGSFLLGMVVGWLDDRHPRLRALLGTGVLGGFTTYSAFAVHAVTTFTASPFVGLALIALSVIGGVLAAGLGLSLARRGTPASGGAPPALPPEDAE